MSEGQINNICDLTPDGPIDSVVILLHGLGSNGQDLISLAPMLAQELPCTVFVSPDAPFACDMVPPGYPNSFQWFSLQDRDSDKMLAGAEMVAPILDAFITQQIEKYNVAPSKVVLLGFSQGTMMSLYAGPRYKEPLGGILGFSGALIGALGAHKMPVRLIHGEGDDVVPVEARAHAAEVLEQSGFDVSGHTTPNLQHSIDQAGISSGVEFLRERLL